MADSDSDASSKGSQVASTSLPSITSAATNSSQYLLWQPSEQSDMVDRAVTLAIEAMQRSRLTNVHEQFSLDRMLFAPLVSPLDLKVSKGSAPLIPIAPIPAQVTLKLDQGSVMPYIARRVSRIPWPKQQSGIRHRALQTWRIIVEENLSATSLGKQLQEMSLASRLDAEISESITDAFAGKSNSTLSRRASSILKYLIWHRKLNGTAGLPLKELLCYEYAKYLRDQAAPTAPQSFLSAVNFCRYFLQMKGAAEVAESARISGVVFAAGKKKRPRKQKRNLFVDEVISMEFQTQTTKCNFDRYALLVFLAILYSRSRYTGYCHAERVESDFDEHDEGFIQADTLNSKMQCTAEQSTTFLPLVAPATGITGFKWGKAFMEERRIQGLTAFKYVLPIPNANGKWIDEPLDVGQAGKWLRDLLRQSGHKDVDNVGTHSLKATCLSWAAKFDSPLETRALLGYHAAREITSTLSYSRDAQAGPLRELIKIIRAIHNKEFFPDDTRSGRIASSSKPDSVKRARTLETAGKAPLTVEATSDPYTEVQDVEFEVESDDSSSSSGSDSESSVSESETKPLQKFSKPKPIDVEGYVAYVHKTSSILHIRSVEQSKLKCGRNLSITYSKFKWQDTAAFLRCGQCFP